MSPDDRVAHWIATLAPRYRGALDSREFLKAVRALSARYVERRDQLSERSPIDSDGKRAAFAAYYAPMHFFTVDALVRAAKLCTRSLDRIVDLGCGTGVVSAAWALVLPSAPSLLGVDASGWPLAEAVWTWRTLGLSGRTVRGDLVEVATREARSRTLAGTGIIAGWSVNELTDAHRAPLLDALIESGKRGAVVLIVEPIGGQTTPWWPRWREAFERAGGRAEEWRLEPSLPESLQVLREAAGFPAAPVPVKSLVLDPGSP